MFSPIAERTLWEKQTFFHLADFFAREEPHAQICRNIFDQLAEAARQRSWQAQELLLATILEAALRNVFNKPFTRKKQLGKFDISNPLSKFVGLYLDGSKWRGARKRAEAAFHRLRDRNAHPDWMLQDKGERPIGDLETSLDDMIFLSKFYGYMILALAGFKDQEPRFPGPHRQWEPTYRMILGPNDGPKTEDALGGGSQSV